MNQTPKNPEQILQAAGGNTMSRDTLKALLASPDAQTLMQLLRDSDGGNLQAATASAITGDTSAIASLLSSLTESREGAEAMAKLNLQFPRKEPF